VVISLVGMRFHVRIGILSHERVHPQPLEIDVAVTRPDDASLLDYRVLYEMAAKAVAAEPLDYLEEVASAVADGALGLPEVRHARVAVRKPHVMLDGPLSYAEIVVERSRG
jgi:dihydroneopterin aldolase